MTAFTGVLTARERQVAGYVLNGSSNKVIAIDLGISLRTVEAHRSRIFRKFGVRHAVAFAHLFYRVQEPGLIDSYLQAQAQTRDGRIIPAAPGNQPQLGAADDDSSLIGSRSG